MKKYLTLAALLGAIAFASVSFLAQAEEHAAPAAETTAAAPAADAGAAAPAPTAEEACKADASKAKEDGSVPTAEEIDASVKKCLEEKAAAHAAEEGHMEEAKEEKMEEGKHE